MDFYFTDRKFNLLGIASTSGDNPFIFADEEDKLSIEAAARTLEGTLYFKPEQSKRVSEMGELGNYILYQDKLGKSVFMTIMEKVHDPLEGTHFVVAEDAGIDLINELVGAYKADKAYNIAYYIEKFTYDSGFEIGINELSTLERKLEWEGDEVTALARILSVATQFGNAEIDFSFTIEGTQVIKRYINIYKKRGNNRRVTLYVNKDINKIVTKGNIYDLGTAIYATGGTPEGQDDPINLKGYDYKDPSERFVLSDTGNLLDTQSVQLWSRLLSNENPNPQKAHILRRKSYETTDKKTLCDNAVRELEKISQPYINFEVDIAMLPESVKIGDTIYLVDEHETLYLSARVLELMQRYSTEDYIAILGDYLIQDDGISVQLKELAEKIKSIPKGDTYYPWVRYADDESGNGISSMPLNKTYMAIKYTLNNPVPSDNPIDYLGLWTKIIGPQGEDGRPGPAGEDGKTTYTWIRYADDVTGAGISEDAKGKMFLGIAYNKDVSTSSNDPRDYNWSAMYDIQRLEEVNKRLNAVNTTQASQIEPNDPQIGDNWFQLDSDGEIKGFSRWDGKAWQPSQIQQDMLIIKKLIAVDIESANITGSKLVNTFKDVLINGEKLTGTTTIEGAEIRIDYKLSNNQTGMLALNPLSIYSVINKADGTLLNSYGLDSTGLIFRDSSIGEGSLTAQNLIKSEWKTLPLASGISIAENNKPMYRIYKNLDGTRQVEFKGQCKGTFGVNGTIVANIPVEARPASSAFAYGATNNGNGGRLAATSAGNLWFHKATADGLSDPSYCALSSLTYSI